MPAKPYQLHAVTQSLCTDCLAVVPAKVVLQDGRVYLLKRCPTHGQHRELLEEVASWYLARDAYNKPGTTAIPQTPIRQGCPHDCGLCPEHEQHTCIALLEITRACDLGCPLCFAHAGSAEGHMPYDEAVRLMDGFSAMEYGKPEVLQVSGGEPTQHPQVIEIIRAARERMRYVMLNTNGLRIAEDDAFVAALAEFRGGFELYLQFDGFDARAAETLRGRDVTAVKRRAVERLSEAGVPVTLVATVQEGINAHELGRLVAFGLEAPCVRGLNIQPMCDFGRVPTASGVDWANRLTLSGVLHRLEEQTSGMLRMSDFIPLPCDVDRVALAFLLRDGKGFQPLARKTDMRAYLELVDNTLAFYPQDLAKNAARALAQEGNFCACFSLLKDAAPLLPLALKARTAADPSRFLGEHTFRITVTSFLDRRNFEMRAMQKECVHILTPDGRRVPFSAYNILHRSPIYAPA